MSSLRLWKTWKISEALLRRARFVIPEIPNSCKEEFDRLDGQLAEMLDHNEHELALDMIEEMGWIAQPRGGFWRDLERAAENMGLNDRVPRIRSEFDKALASIPVAEQYDEGNSAEPGASL